MITITVTLLTLTAIGLLLVVTQYLNRTSAALASAVENVRAVEETQIALLLHERAEDPSVERSFEEEMLRNLADITSGATPDTAASVARAESLVRSYLAGARAEDSPSELPARLASAFSVLDEISDLSIAQAREARDTAARWDRLLDGLGILATAVILMLTGWLLWWMRTQAFQPVFALARAMERLGRGDHDVRAEESGPIELRDMSERFNRMAAALVAQRKAQMSVLAGVAHDLRNPLSALSLSVALIDPTEPLPPEPRIRDTIEMVRRQLKKLERMVSDFLDMAKIDAGQLDLHFAEHDLRTLVREVVSLFEATASEQRIELSLPDEPVPGHCDSLRVEQIVSNLISNAIKYSPRAHKIDVSLLREDGEALITVRDYGIGISEEDQRRLFEPFHRADLGRESIPGAGLGLYVAKRLVAAHGGRIEVDSIPGQGARFVVRLPLSKTTLSEPAPR